MMSNPNEPTEEEGAPSEQENELNMWINDVLHRNTQRALVEPEMYIGEGRVFTGETPEELIAFARQLDSQHDNHSLTRNRLLAIRDVQAGQWGSIDNYILPGNLRLLLIDRAEYRLVRQRFLENEIEIYRNLVPDALKFHYNLIMWTYVSHHYTLRHDLKRDDNDEELPLYLKNELTTRINNIITLLAGILSQYSETALFEKIHALRF